MKMSRMCQKHEERNGRPDPDCPDCLTGDGSDD
jgi:hypothetical protein